MNNATSTAYRSLDPDLPSIAALAAAEVDALIQKRPSQSENLRKLADLLTVSFGDFKQQGQVRRMLDPVSTTVFANTFRDASHAQVNTYDELATSSLDLAKKMSGAVNMSAEDLLGQLKQFCLALSRYSLASKESTGSITKAPDYKR